MNDFLDLATALNSKTLTLFIGSGFSKHLTNGKAPNWTELLIECSKRIDKSNKLIDQLFNSENGIYTNCKYDLTVCAQILEIEYKKKKKDIKSNISEIINEAININTIDQTKLEKIKSFFKKHPNINIVTTNYDTLFSEFIIPKTSRIILNDSTISRTNIGQNIYHIHGSIIKPSSIVLTINDYYNFQNNSNYFSKKFYTLLQENTVAILGYNLGDFNLNTILSEVKNTKKNTFKKTDIYYINRNEIPDILKKFYLNTYGIKVIEHYPIDEFFEEIDKHYDKAVDLIDTAKNIPKIIEGTSIFSIDYLKLRIAFPTVLYQSSILGYEEDNVDIQKILINMCESKKQMTHDNNAWLQYEHLADWLIELASTIDIKNSVIKDKYLDLVKYSLRKSSKETWKGYSWRAWYEWKNRWHEIRIENQHLIEDLINQTTWDPVLKIEEICQ